MTIIKRLFWKYTRYKKYMYYWVYSAYRGHTRPYELINGVKVRRQGYNGLNRDDLIRANWIEIKRISQAFQNATVKQGKESCTAEELAKEYQKIGGNCE